MSVEFDPWNRVTADDGWRLASSETVGTGGGEWIVDPQGTYWLFKPTTFAGNDEENGQDGAEVASSLIGGLLDVPCALTRLCCRGGQRGAISRRIHEPEMEQFVNGRLLLLDVLDVDVHDESEGKTTIRRIGHTLPNIRRALEGVRVPSDFHGPDELTSFDVFVGYLLLDALIANRDRHEDNWAVLEPQTGTDPMILAPSFDHGGALGYNMASSRRKQFLDDAAFRRSWVGRGDAHRLEHRSPPGAVSLVEASVHGLTLASMKGREFWIDRFCTLDLVQCEEQLSAGYLEIGDERLTAMMLIVKTNHSRLKEVLSCL